MQLVTAEQIDESLARQKETHKRLGEQLLDDKLVSELDLTKALATKFGIEYLDLTTLQIDMSAAGLLSERLCRRYSAIPVRFLDDSTLQVAMIDPANVLIADDLRIMTGYTIVPAIASEEDIVGAIGKLNRLDDQVTAANDLKRGRRGRDHRHPRDDRGTAYRQAGELGDRAVRRRRRQRHPLRTAGQGLSLRFRLDGVLHEVMSVPRRMQNGVISRLKVMAEA